MYPHYVFDLKSAGTFGMYPICYWWVSGRYFQPEPAMYSRCFHWFPGPLAPSTWLEVVSVLGAARGAIAALEQLIPWLQEVCFGLCIFT